MRKAYGFSQPVPLPLKGLHKVVEALPLVLRHYPDARVKVAGPDFLSVPAWRRNGYARYLGNLMERLGVGTVFAGWDAWTRNRWAANSGRRMSSFAPP